MQLHQYNKQLEYKAMQSGTTCGKNANDSVIMCSDCNCSLKTETECDAQLLISQISSLSWYSQRLCKDMSVYEVY